METTRTAYGHRLLAAIERARSIAPGVDISKYERQAEIVDLTLAGFTVAEMRALYVAHFSGAPLARGLSRGAVVEALRTKILTRLMED